MVTKNKKILLTQYLCVIVFFSVLLINGISFGEKHPIEPAPDDCEISNIYNGACDIYGYYETVEERSAAVDVFYAAKKEEETDRSKWGCGLEECFKLIWNSTFGWQRTSECLAFILIPAEQENCFCDRSGPDRDLDGTSDECDQCPDNPERTAPDPEYPKCGCTLESELLDDDDDGVPNCREDDKEDGEDDEGCSLNDQSKHGNPIRIYNGNNIESNIDISLKTPFAKGLNFKRYYNSRSAINGVNGFGWTHTFNIKLNPSIGTIDGLIKINDSTGRGIIFKSNGTIYEGMDGEHSTIEETDGLFFWATPQNITYTFDSTGRLINVKDKHGNNQNLAYNAQNLLETVTDEASGRVLSFFYNSNSKIDHIEGPVTDAIPDGIWVTYGYDVNDNLTDVTFPDGSGYTYTYTDPNDVHNLSEKRDKLNHFISNWVYDTDDRAYQCTNRDGKSVTIDYTNPDIVEVTDTYGTTRLYTITEINGRKKVTNVSGQPGCTSCGIDVVRYEYDADRNLIEKEYTNGRIDKYENYDARGNAQTVITAFGTAEQKTYTNSYHPTLNTKIQSSKPSILGAGVNETIRDYDNDYNDIPNEAPTQSLSRLIEKGFTYDSTGAVVAFEYITEYYYNSKGQVTSVDGPLDGDSDKTDYVYDPTTGDLLSVTNQLGTTTFTPDTAGNTVSTTNINNISSVNTFDGKNRLLTSTRDGKISSRTYTLAGYVNSTTDPELRTSTYTYEPNFGRLDKLTDTLGNYHQFSHDTHGNVIEDSLYNISDVLHKKSRSNYEGTDLPGKLWRQINFDDTYSEFGYDSVGNRVSVTSADSKTTSYTYDEFNRVETVTQPGDIVTSYDYDVNGNLISVTDANNNITAYTYDDKSRLVKTVSPDTGTTLYSYNNVGKLLSKRVNSGTETTFSYDALGRLGGIHYADSTQDVTFTHDEGVNGKGRLTGKTGLDYSYSYYYNTSGQITTEEKTIGTASYTTIYTYDNSGILTDITYPDGRTVTYGLNSNGQYQSVSTTKVATTDQLVSNAGYKPFGPNTGFDFGNGINHTKSFNLGYNITVITAGNVQNLTYTPDPTGKITAITNNLDAARHQTFVYDDLNRLESATGIYGNLGYTYDDVGNRTTLTKGTETGTYNYRPDTNIIDNVTGKLAKSFIHNANGNILTASTDQYERLSTGTTEFLYNNDGQRIRKTSGSLKVYYHYDLSGNLIAETDETGILVKAYIYMAGARIATIAVDGTICYYHNNHLATPEVMTDQNGSIVWKADYLPFGKANVDPASTVVNDFRFPGQTFDSETGYHYNWNRYYDPETGRYLTADPIGLLGGVNLYAYVLGNPVNYVDPMGLDIDWLKFARYTNAVSGPYISKFMRVGNQIQRTLVDVGLGKIGVPTSGVAGFALGGPLLGATLYILGSDVELSDPYMGDDGKWHWPNGELLPEPKPWPEEKEPCPEDKDKK